MTLRRRRLGMVLAALLIIGICVLVAWLASFMALVPSAAPLLPTKLDSRLSADYSAQAAGAPNLRPLDAAIIESVADDERVLLPSSGDTELVFAPIFLVDRGNQEIAPAAAQGDDDHGQTTSTATRSPTATSARNGKPSPTATASPRSTPTPKPAATAAPATPTPKPPTATPTAPSSVATTAPQPPTATPAAKPPTATPTTKPTNTPQPPTPTPPTKPTNTPQPPTPSSPPLIPPAASSSA